MDEILSPARLEPLTLDAMHVMDALSAECREVREEAGVRRSSVAHEIGKGQQVIDRFERKETWPTGREIDGLVDAYARLTQVPTIEIWRGALDRALSQTLQETDPDEIAEVEQTAREIEVADTADSVAGRGSRSRASRARKRKAG